VFFSRAIAVPAGATREEVVSQVGLALESLSPFPLAQLYFGYYWPPGAERALAYASYRRRFTVEQLAVWAGAERVIPAFATVLGYAARPATTVVLSSTDGLTAVHWDKGAVPALVLHEALAPDAPADARAAARARLIKAAGEAVKIVDILSPASAAPGGGDRELVFESGEVRSLLPSDVALALDIRDKADLAALAKARRRDMLLWRAAIAAVVLCFLMTLGEAALFGAGLWEKTRITKVGAQKATVSHIMDEQELAGRIDELSTKRLLPLEMISAASPEVAMPKSPPSIQFLRATTPAQNTIQIEAQTSNAGEIAGYKTALEKSPSVDRVEIRDQRARDNVVTFTLIITFKTGALQPAAT
jgi:hypothetical protein